MEYLSYLPKTSLQAVVRCYWTLQSEAARDISRQRIVPDGCMEMIFHRGDPYLQFAEDGTQLQQPLCFVFGQISHFLEIAPTGRSDIFAVRFQPEGFMPFTSYPLKQMENRAVPLTDVFGSEAAALEKAILAAPDTSGCIQLADEFLLDKLRRKNFLDAVVQQSLGILAAANGNLSVQQMSSIQQIHRRKLERRIASSTGLSPKQLAKIIRLQAALKLLMLADLPDLTTVALEGEYYDQAHFIKDFKTFTGMSPKHFFRHDLRLSALFCRDI